MKEVEDLMSECRADGLYLEYLPGQIISHLPIDRVDEYMASLPLEFREVAIDYVQYTYASGQETLRIVEATQEFMAGESALREWVERTGRLHYPRNTDEPDIALILSTLNEQRPKWSGIDSSRIVKRPWKFFQWAMGQNLEEALAALPADAANAIARWSRGAASYEDKWHPGPNELRAAEREILDRWIQRREAQDERDAHSEGDSAPQEPTVRPRPK